MECRSFPLPLQLSLSGSQLLSFGDLTAQLELLKKGALKMSFSLTRNAGNTNGVSSDSRALVLSAMLGGKVFSTAWYVGKVMAVVLALVYSGVHLAAWNSPCFPTGTERL